MAAWTRPYPDPLRVLPVGLASLGTLFLAVAGVGVAASWRVAPPAAIMGFVAFAATWLAFAWRLARTALLVADRGIRVRWVLRTRTIPWDRIRGFHTGPDILVRERLWIDLIDRTKIRTPVQRVRRVATLSDGGAWLKPERYAALLGQLERRRAAATPRATLGERGGG